MKTSRIKNLAFGVTMLGAMIAGTAAVASAQQKPKPQGPPVVTKGSTKANAKAEKGQKTAEAARTEAREEKAEKAATQLAHKEPKDLLKGIKFTDAEEKSTKAIEKKYAAQFKELAKSEKAADKAGMEDPAYTAKVDALRLQERAELRASLTPAQQIMFDKNIIALDAMKSAGKAK